MSKKLKKINESEIFSRKESANSFYISMNLSGNVYISMLVGEGTVGENSVRQTIIGEKK